MLRSHVPLTLPIASHLPRLSERASIRVLFPSLHGIVLPQVLGIVKEFVLAQSFTPEYPFNRRLIPNLVIERISAAGHVGRTKRLCPAVHFGQGCRGESLLPVCRHSAEGLHIGQLVLRRPPHTGVADVLARLVLDGNVQPICSMGCSQQSVGMFDIAVPGAFFGFMIEPLPAAFTAFGNIQRSLGKAIAVRQCIRQRTAKSYCLSQ